MSEKGFDRSVGGENSSPVKEKTLKLKIKSKGGYF